jgi:hypothetical protein
MGYFSQDDLLALTQTNASEKSHVQEQFFALHKKIMEQLQVNDIDLNIVKPTVKAVHNETVSQHTDDNILAVQYMRPRGKAVNVERLMGREEVASANTIITRLHPVSELRLSDSGLAIEFIISPDAWWDQQNVKGKLSVSRHRHEFYSMLMGLQSEYCMGFWQGIHLSEMHLTGKYFQHPRILDEWLSTFHPNADWFRIGIWYDIDDEVISKTEIVPELMKQIQTLFPLYNYFLWTSDNNFREFVAGVS